MSSIGFSSFIALSIVMMAAMMLPSLAPNALLWLRTIRTSSTGFVRTRGVAGYLAGYLLSWAVFGVVAYLLIGLVQRMADSDPSAGRWIGAAIFAVAGVYQLTPLKKICLMKCRTPIGLYLRYAGFGEPARDLRVGVHHGAYCVACCWGLMIVLMAVGAMNVAAMAVLGAIVFTERRWKRGAAIARVAGISLIALAMIALFVPALTPGLRPMVPAAMSG
jgi:predicted metal-binding membrane protein